MSELSREARHVISEIEGVDRHVSLCSARDTLAIKDYLRSRASADRRGDPSWPHADWCSTSQDSVGRQVLGRTTRGKTPLSIVIVFQDALFHLDDASCMRNTRVVEDRVCKRENRFAAVG